MAPTRDSVAATDDQPLGRPKRPNDLLTVAELTSRVREAIVHALPATVHVVGQVSNYKPHSSGHVYLTLKDDTSELSCVMWRSAAKGMQFKLEDGMEVIATGSVDVYQRAGRYQLQVRRFEPRGIGALELAFRQLRDRLAAEGLFDPDHKKPLPNYPERIAIVTSRTGAVVRDMLITLKRRYRLAQLVVMPVRVQGEGAAEEIVRAIGALNRWSVQLGGIDVMIVGRGGGSIEDLWAFNEESVARAVYASRIPIVSAVGHETDVTICDLVADVRAATPTAAAELVVPDANDVAATVEALAGRLRRAAGHRLELERSALAGLLNRRWWREPLTAVRQREQAVDEALTRLVQQAWLRLRETDRRVTRAVSWVQRIQPTAFAAKRAVDLNSAVFRLRHASDRRLREAERMLAGADRALHAASPVHRVGRARDGLTSALQRVSVALTTSHRRWQASLEATEGRLQALSYKGVLGRGFSITRTKTGRKVVRSAADLSDDQVVLTELSDGEVESRIINRKQLELFGSDG